VTKRSPVNAGSGPRETQRARERQQLDQLHAERLAREEVRKAGRRLVREIYGQRYLDRHGRDPDVLEQAGL